MYIQTEETPNPNALKFLPGVSISQEGPLFFNDVKEAATKSKLAVKIFSIENVEAVFFGSDFITVTKKDDKSWEQIKPEILVTIMDHIVAGMSIVETEYSDNKIDQSMLSEIEKQIIEIIETRVRPSVAMDGGDITYEGFKEGVVYLKLKGACSGCPSSSVTLKSGIENMLQHFVPEVKSVEEV